MGQEAKSPIGLLPQRVLCQIMSDIPLSKQKLRLALVSKDWLSALLNPDSHSQDLPEQVCAHSERFDRMSYV